MTNLQMIREICTLSGSTEASIYGTPNYEEIEKRRTLFIEWIIKQPDKKWDTWQDCVKEYKEQNMETGTYLLVLSDPDNYLIPEMKLMGQAPCYSYGSLEDAKKSKEFIEREMFFKCRIVQIVE